jgi:cephalosporin hydroxylase
MRVPQFETRVLGANPVYCDGCDRLIPPEETRRWCSTCERDCCGSCPVCAQDGHVVVAYEGFPRFAGLRHEVLDAAMAHLDESFGSAFAVRGNVYLHGWLTRLLATLSLKKHLQSVPGAARTTPTGPARRAARLLWALEEGEEYLRNWVSLRGMGRFVDYFDRRAFAGRLPASSAWVHSQGAIAPLGWKGRPMMRTAWDFALSAMMVQEIRPATIIELGTASGASAMWYADLQSTHDIRPNVITMDVAPPSLSYDGVRFVRGDSAQIETALTGEWLATQPHPWLVVEDAHRNIGGILRHFHGLFERGDYLTIEDIDAERDLVAFLPAYPEMYKVDTRYTDFFGHNATAAADQIFCRMQ